MTLFQNKKFRLFFVTSGCLFVLLYANYFSLLPHQVDPGELKQIQYGYAADYYLKIAKAAGETNLPLVYRHEQDGYRLYNPRYGDEYGYPMMLSFLSILGFDITTQLTCSKINLLIFWVTMGLFAALIGVFFRSVYHPVFLLAATVCWFLPRGKHLIVEYADHHGLVPSLFVLGLGICLFIFWALSRWDRKRFAFYPAIVLLSVSLGMLGIFRQLIGYNFAAVILGICAWELLRNRFGRDSIVIVVLLVLPFALIFKFAVPLTYLYSQTRLDLVSVSVPLDHGKWHPLLCGVGVYENALGLKWNDDLVIEYIRGKAGNVKVNSKEYKEAAKQIYLNYVSEYPLEYMKNTITKLKVVVKSIMKQFPVNYWMCFLTLTLMTGILLKKHLIFLPFILMVYAFILTMYHLFVLNIIFAFIITIRHRKEFEFRILGLVLLPAVLLSLVFPALTHYFFRSSSLIGFFIYFVFLCFVLVGRLVAIRFPMDALSRINQTADKNV